VKNIFALILVLSIFKHPRYRIRKNCVDMCARDGSGQWREGGRGKTGRRPRASKAGGHRKCEITKL